MRSTKFHPEKRYEGTPGADGKVKSADGSNLVTTNVPIIARFTYELGRLNYFTGIRLDTIKWDEDKQRMKRNTTQGLYTSTEINSKLDDIAHAIKKIHESYHGRITDLTPEIFKEELKIKLGIHKKVSREMLTDYFDEFLRTRAKIRADATFSSWEQFRTRINAFNTPLNKLGKEYYTGFVNSVGPMNSTKNKYLIQMKSFIKYLVKQKYIPPQEIDIELDLPTFNEMYQQNKVALTFDELKKIEKLKDLTSELELVRDVFIFNCFTGVRVGDLVRLTSDNIDGNYELLIHEAHKTGIKVIQPLNKKAIQLIKKYHGKYPTLMPFIWLNKYNAGIREIAEIAGIDAKVIKFENGKPKKKPKYELMSSHTARKTFIVNALELGVDPIRVMAWVGHQNWSSFQHYRTTREEKTRTDMEKFNRF